ncbi:MAG: hypothetical protein AABZ55_01650 [Bdellovibrionota bacterium]
MKNLIKPRWKAWSTAFVVVIAFAGQSVAMGPGGKSSHHPGNFAGGIVLGEPTGLSGKLWTDSEHAIDMGLAFSVNDYVLFFADYLMHYPGGFGHSSEFISRVNPYVGVGAVMAFSSSKKYNNTFFGTSSNSVGLGVRVPLGAEWRPSDGRIGVFAEFVPGISVTPATAMLIWGGVGIRYYF